jgi:uncharacterized membrane protein
MLIVHRSKILYYYIMIYENAFCTVLCGMLLASDFKLFAGLIQSFRLLCSTRERNRMTPKQQLELLIRSLATVESLAYS